MEVALGRLTLHREGLARAFRSLLQANQKHACLPKIFHFFKHPLDNTQTDQQLNAITHTLRNLSRLTQLTQLTLTRLPTRLSNALPASLHGSRFHPRQDPIYPP